MASPHVSRPRLALGALFFGLPAAFLLWLGFGLASEMAEHPPKEPALVGVLVGGLILLGVRLAWTAMGRASALRAARAPLLDLPPSADFDALARRAAPREDWVVAALVARAAARTESASARLLLWGQLPPALVGGLIGLLGPPREGWDGPLVAGGFFLVAYEAVLLAIWNTLDRGAYSLRTLAEAGRTFEARITAAGPSPRGAGLVVSVEWRDAGGEPRPASLLPPRDLARRLEAGQEATLLVLPDRADVMGLVVPDFGLFPARATGQVPPVGSVAHPDGCVPDAAGQGPTDDRTAPPAFRPTDDRTAPPAFRPTDDRTAHPAFRPTGDRTAPPAFRPTDDRTAPPAFRPTDDGRLVPEDAPRAPQTLRGGGSSPSAPSWLTAPRPAPRRAPGWPLWVFGPAVALWLWMGVALVVHQRRVASLTEADATPGTVVSARPVAAEGRHPGFGLLRVALHGSEPVPEVPVRVPQADLPRSPPGTPLRVWVLDAAMAGRQVLSEAGLDTLADAQAQPATGAWILLGLAALVAWAVFRAARRRWMLRHAPLVSATVTEIRPLRPTESWRGFVFARTRHRPRGGVPVRIAFRYETPLGPMVWADEMAVFPGAVGDTVYVAWSARRSYIYGWVAAGSSLATPL